MRSNGLLSGIILWWSRTFGGKLSKPSIDYPQAGDKVTRGRYAVRISGCAGECQAAIDGGDWQPCRSADGYCWYDWCPAETGRHRISVRARVGNAWVKDERTCRVV